MSFPSFRFHLSHPHHSVVEHKTYKAFFLLPTTTKIFFFPPPSHARHCAPLTFPCAAWLLWVSPELSCHSAQCFIIIILPCLLIKWRLAVRTPEVDVCTIISLPAAAKHKEARSEEAKSCRVHIKVQVMHIGANHTF